MLGDSRIPDVAEANRISTIEEANVGQLAYFVSVDSKARSTALRIYSRSEVTCVFLCDVKLLILQDYVAQT